MYAQYLLCTICYQYYFFTPTFIDLIPTFYITLDPTPTFLDTHLISKRGTSFGDFLRGLFVEVEPPEAVRQGRQNRPSSIPLSPPGKKEKHENINIDPDPSSKKNLSEDLPDDNVGYTNIGSGLVSGSSTAGVKNWNLNLFQMPL